MLPDAEISLANNFDMLLQFLAERHFTLGIFDVNMPGSNSFRMIEIVKSIQPDLKTIIYSAFDENIYAPIFIKAGADAFINKEAENDHLVDVIRRLVNGETDGSGDGGIKDKVATTRNVNMLNPIALLSVRELEVANLLIKGMGTMEICYALNLNKNTISTYKKRIYEKLGITTIPELISIYRNYSNDNL
jgi:DNA-binding NarL/FixJ family response regulator